MDSWVVGQFAFWYTVYEVSPTTVVDKLIEFWLDVTIPGRGTGGSNWCVWSMLSIEVQPVFDTHTHTHECHCSALSLSS